MKLQESGENYLESIFVITKEKGSVRSIDVARDLGFSKPSISRAMNLLKTEGFITIEANGNILLTDKGYQKASDVYDRHLQIKQFLIDILKIDSKIAEEDACRIEHVISKETFEAMKTLVIKK